MAGLPASVVAVDVETTGFRADDRIVTLGAWRVNTAELVGSTYEVQCIHVVADPGKKSHPRAEQVHGYSDWVLRHQQPFSEQAAEVRDFLAKADVVVAHNISFDMEFIDREYRALGQPLQMPNCFCTMEEYRQRDMGSASLNAVCQTIGLVRGGDKHGALEDAWLALMAYFWLQNVHPRHIQSFARVDERGASTTPTNYKLPPPLPDGPLPRRRKATTKPARKKVVDTVALVAKAALLDAVRPTATLLLEIARADEHLAAAEVDVLVGLIRATRDRLGVVIDGEAEIDVLGDLFDIKLRPNLLTDAARALCTDPPAREAFPKLVATLARADGSVSESERAGIDRVKAAITGALAEPRPRADGNP